MAWAYYVIAGAAGLLYLGLLVLALRGWALDRRTRHLTRWLWLVIIVIFSIVGPTAYLALGRPGKPTDGSASGSGAWARPLVRGIRLANPLSFDGLGMTRGWGSGLVAVARDDQ